MPSASHHPQRLLLLFLLAAAAALTACDDGPPREVIAQATVGPAGGVVDSGDGRVRLVIPPGALASETAISIATAKATADLLDGSTFDFAPDGTHFALPATLTLSFDPTALPPGADPEAVGIGKAVTVDGEELVLLEDEGHTDLGARTVSGRIEGFSSHGAVVHVPCDRFSGVLTAEYNPDRTISLAWQTALSTASLEVARLTNIQAGSPGALWPREADFQVVHPYVPGTWQTTYPAGSEAALLYFRIRPRCGQTLGRPSEPAMVPVFGLPRVPYPPAALRAMATTPTRIELMWTGDPWADRYEVERSTDQATWDRRPTASGQSISYTDQSGLQPGTQYIYRVRARGSEGDSAWAHAWATTPVSPAPPSPSGLVGTATGPTSLAFTWLLDPALADEVRISRTDAGAQVAQPLTSVPGAVTTFEDTGLTPDTAYTYAFTSLLAGTPGGTATLTLRTPPPASIVSPPTPPVGGSSTVDCGDFELSLDPGAVALSFGTTTIDISIARKPGFTGVVGLEFDRWCDGRLPLCEVAQVSFCAATCEHEYTAVLGPAESTTRLAIEVYFDAAVGWSTELDVVAPDYPGCRATLAIDIP